MSILFSEKEDSANSISGVGVTDRGDLIFIGGRTDLFLNLIYFLSMSVFESVLGQVVGVS